MRRESRPEDAAAQRALAGARLAVVAVVAGALATAASLIAVAFVATLGSEAPSVKGTPRLVSHTVARPVAEPLADEITERPDATSSAREERIGNFVLADVPPNVGSLDDELDRQRSLALRAGQRFVVWLVIDDCLPCDAVTKTLGSPQLGKTLGDTRFARVNAVHFLVELSRLGVPLDAFPAFLLLGDDGSVRDYIHGGEWGADLPRNIAPVLKSFVEGTYHERRVPWRGGLHDDETAI